MPFRPQIALIFALIFSVALPLSAQAGTSLKLLEATPVGSWSLREETTTDHRGRATVNVIRTSMLSKEERNGQTYYWVEMVNENFKVKGDKRKPVGERMVVKSLMSEQFLSGDPANAIQNLRGFGEELIVQNGNSQPMRISGAGGFAEGLMKGMGAEINYNFSEQGNESVTVPAGSFDTKVLVGEGSTEMKVIFKKITVASKTTSYFSDKVPFGIVKADGESVTNGKVSTHSTRLLEYGRSGAQSQMTGEPQDMPNMPNIGDILGGGNR